MTRDDLVEMLRTAVGPGVRVVAGGRGGADWYLMVGEVTVAGVVAGPVNGSWRSWPSVVGVDGDRWVLSRSGRVVREVPGWDREGLAGLLREAARPCPPGKYQEIVGVFAAFTRTLRDRVGAVLRGGPGAARDWLAGLRAGWVEFCGDANSDFGDVFASMVAMGLFTARYEQVFGVTGVDRGWVRGLDDWLGHPQVVVVEGEIGLLRWFVNGLDADRFRVVEEHLNRGRRAGDGVWHYFYEDFLAVYDPALKRRSGVFYTPERIVMFMVDAVEWLLVHRCGVVDGFSDRRVHVLDPAVGTGAFPVGVLRHVRSRWGTEAAVGMVPRVHGFEILPSALSVALLRVAETVVGCGGDPGVVHVPGGGLRLGNMFASPWDTDRLGEFSVESGTVAAMKRDGRVRVVIGNPPFGRPPSVSWVAKGDRNVAHPAVPLRAHFPGSGHALNDMYVEGYHLARWMTVVNDPHPDGAQFGLFALVTPSTWLDGVSFAGMRERLRAEFDDLFIVDLGGDVRLNRPDENLFRIQVPVSVVFGVRDPGRRWDELRPGRVRYTRVAGTVGEKTGWLEQVTFDRVEWEDIPVGSPVLVPRDRMPSGRVGLLDGVFSPTVTGVFAAPIRFAVAFTESHARERWDWLTGASPAERAAEVEWTTRKRPPDVPVTGWDGRTLPAVTSPGFGGPPVGGFVPVTWAPLDTRWLICDPRVVKSVPDCWETHHPGQLYLLSCPADQSGPGPLMWVAAHPPMWTAFGRRAWKSHVAVWRDPDHERSSVSGDLMVRLEQAWGFPVGPLTVVEYVYGLVGTGVWQEHVQGRVHRGDQGVPFTGDGDLAAEIIRFGKFLIGVHLFDDVLPDLPAVGDVRVPVVSPGEPRDGWGYDPDGQVLRVAGWDVTGVGEGTVGFRVANVPVLRRWLTARTVTPQKVWEHPAPIIGAELFKVVRAASVTVGVEPYARDLITRVLGTATVDVSGVRPEPGGFWNVPGVARQASLF